MADKPIGTILKERRLELGLSAQSVAKYAGIKRESYSRIERSDSNPRFRTLGPILSILALEMGVCLLSCDVADHNHVEVRKSDVV